MQADPAPVPTITEVQEDEIIIWLASRLRIMAWQKSFAALSEAELVLTSELVLEWLWLRKWRNDFRILTGVLLINAGVMLAMFVVLCLPSNVSVTLWFDMVGLLFGLNASMAIFISLINVWRARIVPRRRPRYIPRSLWGAER